MNTLFIDNRMGISGAKLLGALLDMMEAPETFIRRFNDMGFKGVKLEKHAEALKGITGSKVEFIRVSSNIEEEYYQYEADDDQEKEDKGRRSLFSRRRQETSEGNSHRSSSRHRRLNDVKAIIDDLPLSGKIRKRAINIYERIAAASAAANKLDINELKLHRTGSRDVIAAVVGVCMIMDELEPESVVASPVATGTGYANTYRGIMPIPIPALQNILEQTPYSSGKEEGEICTLEGAAILREYVDKFSDMPEIVVIKSGAGFGNREFRTGVNCTRVFIGQVVATAANSSVTELEASLFDDSAEALKLTGEKLAACGAIEAFTLPISMLTGGTGILLRCICPNERADEAAGEILRNTSARSVRRAVTAAYDTESVIDKITTSVGEIRVLKTTGFGVTKTKPLAEDVAKVARERNISILQAYEMIIKEI